MSPVLEEFFASAGPFHPIYSVVGRKGQVQDKLQDSYTGKYVTLQQPKAGKVESKKTFHCKHGTVEPLKVIARPTGLPSG